MRPVSELEQKLTALKGHSEDVIRDFSEIRKTLAPRFFINKNHREAIASSKEKGSSGQVIAGDPSAIREQLDELAELGFDFIVATFPNFQDLDYRKLFVNEVMPYYA